MTDQDIDPGEAIAAAVKKKQEQKAQRGKAYDQEIREAKPAEILAKYNEICTKIDTLLPGIDHILADIVALDQKIDRYSNTGIYLRRQIRIKELFKILAVAHNQIGKFSKFASKVNTPQNQAMLIGEASSSSEPVFK